MPTVNAIAPNAAIGATYMAKATILKKTCETAYTPSIIGPPFGPSASSAKPNITEKNSTGSTSPSAKAPTALVGTRVMRNSP